MLLVDRSPSIVGIVIDGVVRLVGIVSMVLWGLRFNDGEGVVEGRNVEKLSLKDRFKLASDYLVFPFEVVQQVSLILNVQHFTDSQVLKGSCLLEYFLEEWGQCFTAVLAEGSGTKLAKSANLLQVETGKDGVILSWLIVAFKEMIHHSRTSIISKRVKIVRVFTTFHKDVVIEH